MWQRNKQCRWMHLRNAPSARWGHMPAEITAKLVWCSDNKLCQETLTDESWNISGLCATSFETAGSSSQNSRAPLSSYPLYIPKSWKVLLDEKAQCYSAVNHSFREQPALLLINAPAADFWVCVVFFFFIFKFPHSLGFSKAILIGRSCGKEAQAYTDLLFQSHHAGIWGWVSALAQAARGELPPSTLAHFTW